MSFRPMRALVAAFLMAGWVFATNHCALGLMPGSAVHASCHHCAPSHQAPTGGQARECCQDLRGVLPAGCVVKPASERASLALDGVLADRREAGRDSLLGQGERDTGPPPEVEWLGETVWQRVSQGNAPPHEG